MIRRAFLAATAALAFTREPSRAAVCPPPYVREGNPLVLALKTDLHRWALTNRGQRATVLLTPALAFLVDEMGVQGQYVDGTTNYTLTVLPQIPPTVPWVIAAECLELV